MKKWLILLLLTFNLLLSQKIIAAEPNDTDVLVFGGTGRLGSEIVKVLVENNYRVTVFARASSNRGRLQDYEVNFLIGDVLDANSVNTAISSDRFEVIIDALGRGSSPVEFYKTSAENIVNSARQNGVEQLILHGSIGAGNSSMHDAGMKKLFAAKTSGENAVIESGITYTIIRNGHLIRYGAGDNGNARLFDDMKMTGSVTRAALGRLTTDCVLATSCENKILHAIDPSR